MLPNIISKVNYILANKLVSKESGVSMREMKKQLRALVRKKIKENFHNDSLRNQLMGSFIDWAEPVSLDGQN